MFQSVAEGKGLLTQGQELCVSLVLSVSSVEVGDWGVTPVRAGVV